MTEDDYLDESPTYEAGDARDGYFWVNASTHEILATGDEPKPVGKSNVKLRRYFSDLDRGLTEFAEYQSNLSKREEVLRVCDEVSEYLKQPFRECFFVVNEDRIRTQDYLAIVFGDRRSASVWAKKNVIHCITQVRNSTRLKNKIYIFQVELAGFHEKGDKQVHAGGSVKKVCPLTHLELPMSGKCDNETADCPVCQSSEN